jgi:hypothetical protein
MIIKLKEIKLRRLYRQLINVAGSDLSIRLKLIVVELRPNFFK